MKLIIMVFLALIIALPARAGEINLSVAASLRDVMNELSDNYAARNPGVRFLKNYGGSGALAKQIENGAPADIYISANREWLQYVEKKKLIDNSSVGVFAYNTLVLVGPSVKKVSSLQDILRFDKIAIGSPKSVPAGEYAMEAMKRAGIEKQVEKRLVMARDVRECLMYAERGEVDGAFVYRTDALQAKRAKIIFTVPQNLYPRVTYPMGLTTAGTGNVDAKAFYRFLRTEGARSVLVKYGFMVR
jgi:molybdate transport system substrate-binding protein